MYLQDVTGTSAHGGINKRWVKTRITRCYSHLSITTIRAYPKRPLKNMALRRVTRRTKSGDFLKTGDVAAQRNQNGGLCQGRAGRLHERNGRRRSRMDGKTLWKTADRYLSGDVTAKLRIATEAAHHDSQYQDNVDALRRVQPEDIAPIDISI